MGQIELVVRRFGKEVEASWVLVRMSADLMTLELPAMVSVQGKAGPWGLHTLPEDEAGGEASELAAALNSLVRGAERPRPKLGVFSGATPTGDGEVGYDNWIENTSLLLEAWPGSDEEKRQRLLGSLRGGAARVVQELKAEQPLASLEEYLQVLEGAFGMSGYPCLLLAEFHHMEQERGEKLSEYIFRPERMLTGLRRQGVVKAHEVARLRMSQIFSGSLEEDKVAWSLRLSYKKSPCPSFR
ncbi:modulator of apoptosis 1-like [Hemitrygon akajei]|uniref:modulator of apoptosis 1-like n=1 Tax=Hemitrygon akajei TaxID=2704970 RepID=UPI003BF9AA2C